MPGNEKWYSFEFGNALFICLFSEQDFATQHTWLVNELVNTTKTWNIVFFHKPFFTTGSHADDMNNYLNTWWKAFDDYGVDVVLGGHTHYYLRSKPINLNVSSTSPVDEYGSGANQGRLQIVAGSYGASLASTGSGWFIEENVSTMNYTKFEINDNVLMMNAYNMTGSLIDSITIVKQDVIGFTSTETSVPAEFTLHQNYPNPFNLITIIQYELHQRAQVSITILDLQGRQVKSLISDWQDAGHHSVAWDASNDKGQPASAGMYFYQIRSGEHVQTRKMLLLK